MKDTSSGTNAIMKITIVSPMDWDVVQSINEEYSLWLNEQVHAANISKWSGPLKTAMMNEDSMGKVALGAYGEAAKKNNDRYTELLIWALHLLDEMEKTKDSLSKGFVHEAPASEYLEGALPWIRDSLEFGLPQNEKEAFFKLHQEELAKLKEDNFNTIADGCKEVVEKQTQRAKDFLVTGMPPMELLKEVAREAYFCGAYEGAGEIKRLKVSAETVVTGLDSDKNEMKSGASPQITTSKYLEVSIPRIRESMRSDGLGKGLRKVK